MRLAIRASFASGLLAVSIHAQDHVPVLTDRTQLSNGGTVAAMSDLHVSDDGSWSANVLYYLPTREGAAFVRNGEIVYDARPGTTVKWAVENTKGDYVLCVDNQSLADPRWTLVWNGAVLLRFPDAAQGVLEGLSDFGDEAQLTDAGELLIEVFVPDVLNPGFTAQRYAKVVIGSEGEALDIVTLATEGDPVQSTAIDSSIYRMTHPTLVPGGDVVYTAYYQVPGPEIDWAVLVGEQVVVEPGDLAPGGGTWVNEAYGFVDLALNGDRLWRGVTTAGTLMATDSGFSVIEGAVYPEWSPEQLLAAEPFGYAGGRSVLWGARFDLSYETNHQLLLADRSLLAVEEQSVLGHPIRWIHDAALSPNARFAISLVEIPAPSSLPSGFEPVRALIVLPTAG